MPDEGSSSAEGSTASEAVEFGRALTGAALPLTAQDPAALVAELEACGWSAMRLSELRSARQMEGLPWPFPVDLAARRAIGFARFDARLAELRRLLGLDGLVSVAPAHDRTLDPDERRLTADRPPHWG